MKSLISLAAFALGASMVVPQESSLVSELRAARGISDAEDRLLAFDRIVDELPVPLATAPPRMSELPEDERAFVALQEKAVARIADDMARAFEISKQLPMTFDDDEKLRLANAGRPLIERIEAWQQSEEALQFVQTYGTDIGYGFRVLLMGRRTLEGLVTSTDSFLFAITYAGDRPWRLAKVSWDVIDLLGDQAVRGTGKVLPRDLEGTIYIVNVDENMFRSTETSHVVEWRDGVVVPRGLPEVVWAD